MWRIKKIKAFTLAELLVAMVVTAIVVTLALGVLSLFGKNIQLIQENYSQSTQLDLLEQQLSVDFSRYQGKWFENQNGILYFKNPLDSITYEFSEGYLLRSLDTVFKGALENKYYFNGREVSSGKIDAIKLIIEKKQQQSFLFVFSKKDAQQLMSQDGD